MSEFAHIGFEYCLGSPFRLLGRGVVMLSPEACFFVSSILNPNSEWRHPDRVQLRLHRAFQHYGFHIRAALATNELVTFSDLPRTVTAGDYWPFRPEDGHFFALPRASALQVIYPFLGNLQITIPSRRITVFNWFFRRNKVLKALKAYGWLEDAAQLEHKR